MNRTTRSAWRNLLAALILITGLSMPANSPQAQSFGNPGVIPPNAKPYGMNYSDWAVKWAQWSNSLGLDDNPITDETGCLNGAKGQSGPVWFLTGGYSPIIEGYTYKFIANRDCVVPTDKAIFIPIISALYYEYLDGPLTPEDLDEIVRVAFEHITYLEVSVDGVEMKNLRDYRAYSPLFQIGPFPANSIWGDQEGAYANAVMDGYYLIHTPMSVGKHTIHFRGEAEFTQEQDGYDFKFIGDITYHLSVISHRP